MEKYFATYNQALALKKLGFDEPCLAFYYDKTKFLCLGQKPEYLVNKRKASYVFGNEKHDVTLAPLKSQVFEWFRDKHLLFNEIALDTYGEPCELKVTISQLNPTRMFITKHYFPYVNGIGGIDNDKHEEAELACIDKLIEIVKNEKV